MKLLFELGDNQNGCDLFPEIETPIVELGEKAREIQLRLPCLSENEISRHYTRLAEQTYGVNNGFYPLGSCTMKYNPKINEIMAALPGFTNIHPLAAQKDVQGCLELLKKTETYLGEITGMDAVTMQPAAGAHGEFTGLLLIKAYHEERKDFERKKIIVPDSAHGTNPASAAMAGFTIVNIASDEHGCVDLEKLRAAVGEDTAGLMLTNPNTVGLFDPNIEEITNIVHEAGGLCYYDGANLNAIMGYTRPGDMGFDVMHLNLHKTFSTPHGGGGPGSGPVGCKAFLQKYLPGKQPRMEGNTYTMQMPEASVGNMRNFWGNFLVVVRAYTYLVTLGSEGILEASQNAVLNANYMMSKLKSYYTMAYDQICMHEFVMSLKELKKDKDVSALDVAKALLDHGIHPPTMYFPLIVHEALMIEPTETESKEQLDEVIDLFIQILEECNNEPQNMHSYPRNTVIGRLDEVGAARNPITKYVWE